MDQADQALARTGGRSTAANQRWPARKAGSRWASSAEKDDASMTSFYPFGPVSSEPTRAQALQAFAPSGWTQTV